MKRIIALIAIVSLTGCAALKTDIVTWYNSPAGQAEISAIETAALNIATAFITSLIANPATGTQPISLDNPQVVAAENAEIASLEKRFPDAPTDAIKLKVVTAFSTAINSHNASIHHNGLP